MKIYEYSVKNAFTKQNIAQKLLFLTQQQDNIIFIFVGTDANIGDSLGPLTGTLVEFESEFCRFYGSLKNPITAKEVPFISEYIKNAHPESFVIVVDAAIGRGEDLGVIKVLEGGIQPGLGVNKNLPLIGDLSIIGVMGEKSPLGGQNYNFVRLSTVYETAGIISAGIVEFLHEKGKQLKLLNRA